MEADLAALSHVKQREDEKGSPSVVTSEHGHELDGIHDGLEFPTEEERATLRRVSDTIPWNAYRTSPCSRGPIYIDHYFIKVIAVVELAERFSVGIKLLVCSVYVNNPSAVLRMPSRIRKFSVYVALVVHKSLNLEQLYSTTLTAGWLSHRCGFYEWTIWCSGTWSAGVYGSQHFLPVLVNI